MVFLVPLQNVPVASDLYDTYVEILTDSDVKDEVELQAAVTASLLPSSHVHSMLERRVCSTDNPFAMK